MWIAVIHLNKNPSLSLQATVSKISELSHFLVKMSAIGVKGWLKDEIIEENQDVFDGFGCLEGTYSITIKDTIKLVTHLPGNFQSHSEPYLK